MLCERSLRNAVYIYVCVRVSRATVCKCRALASSRGSSYDLKNEICFCVASLMAYTLCVCKKFCYLRYSQDAAPRELSINHKQGLRFIPDDASSAAVVQLTVRNSAGKSIGHG